MVFPIFRVAARMLNGQNHRLAQVHFIDDEVRKSAHSNAADFSLSQNCFKARMACWVRRNRVIASLDALYEVGRQHFALGNIVFDGLEEVEMSSRNNSEPAHEFLAAIFARALAIESVASINLASPPLSSLDRRLISCCQ